MLHPALIFSSDRVRITAGAAQAPDSISQGVGFMSTGKLAIDTNAVAGSNSPSGIARNAAGAIYGTTSVAAGDVFQGGLRYSQSGQLVYVDAAGVGFCNGNPVDANGALATTSA